MSYQYYDKWYDKNNTPYNKKKRETTMSIRDAPQEKVGKAHKKTTNERGRPGNPDNETLVITVNLSRILKGLTNAIN